jgi:hypothetical protein
MTRRFLFDAERQREIARLEARRDAVLRQAPRAFAFRRVFAPVMFLLLLVQLGAAALFHPDKLSLATGLLIGGFLLWLGSMVWRTWIHPPAKGDLWGYADTIGYDGDSPREIQRKIDVLRRSRRPAP